MTNFFREIEEKKGEINLQETMMLIQDPRGQWPIRFMYRGSLCYYKTCFICKVAYKHFKISITTPWAQKTFETPSQNKQQEKTCVLFSPFSQCQVVNTLHGSLLIDPQNYWLSTVTDAFPCFFPFFIFHCFMWWNTCLNNIFLCMICRRVVWWIT